MRIAALAGAVSLIAMTALGTAEAGATAVVPSAPTGVSAVAGFQSANIMWTVGADGGSPITGFVITVYINASQVAQADIPAGAAGSQLDPTPGAADSYDLVGHTGGNGYTFTIAASNAIGTGAPSVQTNSVNPTNTPSSASLSWSQASFNFGPTTLGDSSDSVSLTLTNTGTSADNITDFNFAGADPNDFLQTDESQCQLAPLAAGATCTVDLAFLPGALGGRTATVTPVDSSTNPPSITLTGTGTEGYYIVTADGEVDNFGDAQWYGDASNTPLAAPIVSLAVTGDNGGYWLTDARGDVFSYGDAPFRGSAGNIHLNHPIVGMAPTPDNDGYWLVASDGGIFAFGDAPYFGSTGGIHLNKPIVGMALTADGEGYWLVASDGGIFAFGDAQFYGSTGNIHLNKPVVGMAVTPTGNGYWMVASDGGIFAFGDAPFYGSTGAIRLNQPIVGMAASPTGRGYWFTAADGGVFSYGDAQFYGSDSGQGVDNAVGMAYDGYYTLQAFLGIPAFRQASHSELQARVKSK